MRFDYSIHHTPGISLYLADGLSRAPIANSNQKIESDAEKEAENLVDAVLASQSTEEVHLEKYRKAQAEDPVCAKVIEFCQSGWPRSNKLSDHVAIYYPFRASLTNTRQLLLYGSRIVIPTTLRKSVMGKVHSGHLGIQRCKRRVSQSVWRPGAVILIIISSYICPSSTNRFV